MSAPHGIARRARWPGPRRLCAALGIVLGAACMRVAHAQVQASEVQVKAAFIYNFALFTTWPPDAMQADAPMVVCVTAEHPLQAALEKLTGKPVRGHRLEIRKLNDGTVAGCHVLVFDARAWTGVRVDPATPLLTVSEQPRSQRAAGAPDPMIVLALQDDRVVFDIDAMAARHARLQLSSQLLRLARSVQ
ncbi:YfiR family protein [Ralstonia soli]|uniref:YfiR family protein n=1 Tax=Ralstonia soli TaxID=2953896 RepID=A0ABT1AHP0_9RALS|nr:YfiR family protein [Ralstonia soli]MCO5397913.1 YfiR family protein [Ralstonia soli]